jgi:non-specific serine/threonine protein kinase
LPQATTHFIGREPEISEIQNILNETRLLTLTGSPGIGKTRLAMRVVTGMSGTFANGIHLVDLVKIKENAMVSKAVASELHVSEEPGRQIIESLRDNLKAKELLLILDNCEHVTEGAAALAELLLSSAGGIKILATSRESLDIRGETILTVKPLSFPAKEQLSDIKAIKTCEAVKLFIELSKQRDPHFKIGKHNIFFIGELCRQLEGIPLSIELAAARIDTLQVHQILSLMADRFKLLRRSGGDSSRHRTLEGAVDWSYESLSKEEMALLRRLSIFTGGWTLDAAASVCSSESINEENILYLLSQLRKKSLIKPRGMDGREGYHMLEMIRQYSFEKLQNIGEAAEIAHRHAKYFTEFSEHAFDEGMADGWVARMEEDNGNLRAALQYTIRTDGDIELGLRLCGALGRFWFIRGHISEAIRWTSTALSLDEGRHKDARAKALRTAGFFFGHMADSDAEASRGPECFEESISIWRELDNKRELAMTLTNYSFLLNRRGDFSAANRVIRESLDIFGAIGDFGNFARANHNLALSLLDQGEYEQAIPLFEESLEKARMPDVADKYLQALCLHNLGEAEYQKGDLKAADKKLKQCLMISKELGHRSLSARSMIIQGELAARRGNYLPALEKQVAALNQLNDINDKQGVIDAIEAIACTRSMLSDDRGALILYSGAQRWRATRNIFLGPARQQLLESCLDSSRKRLGKAKTKQLLHESETYELEMIINFAIGTL